MGLAQQGMDFSKMRGGKKEQKQLSQAIAMESASRVMTPQGARHAQVHCDGEYKPVEETAEEKPETVSVEPNQETSESAVETRKSPQSRILQDAVFHQLTTSLQGASVKCACNDIFHQSLTKIQYILCIIVATKGDKYDPRF